MKSSLLTLALLGLFAAAASAAPAPSAYHTAKGPADLADQPVVTVPWTDPPGTAVDVSFLLDAPAGKRGPIVSRHGHFATADGQPIRFWGVNVTGAAGLPAKENAPRLAALLARSGVNCVRFHFLDRVAPLGLIAAGRDDTRTLDPAQLERLDVFVAALKQRGIYTDLNLNVARTYKPGDGVKDHALLGFAKALTFFDPRLLELQREYARQLLSHRNPHLGTTYAQEPAVALIEFVNENSLIEAWKDGRLRGTNTRPNPGTWSDIPASYAADLTERFNAWLRTEQPAPVVQAWRERAGLPRDAPLPRLQPDQFAAAPADRFHAEAEFYLALERRYYVEMAAYLRDELGVRALLIGNSDHGHARTGYPQLLGTSLLDVVDGHVYWQHPKYQTDSVTGRQTGFTIGNTPMVDDPLHSTVVELSRSAVTGKPFTVSEVNHPFPHEFATEGIPILAAYAAFQDWDGVFWYTLEHREVGTTEAKVSGHFDLAMDPVKMAQLPVGALLFLRRDVRPAARTVARTYTREQVRESIRLPYALRPYFTPGFPNALPLRHGSRIASFAGPATGDFPGAASDPLATDTGELAWQSGAPGHGLVTVDTARTQAAIGFPGAGRVRLRHLAVDARTAFCAVTVSALDEAPLAQARRLWVTANARMANSGMEWNAARTSLVTWGGAPTRLEPVQATLRLTRLAPARAVAITPVTPAGERHPARSAVARDQAWELELDAPVNTYLITVER